MIVSAVLLSSVAGGDTFNVLASMYSDYGESSGGTLLWKYPQRGVYLPKVDKKVTIYPVAIYSDRVQYWKYRVLVLKNPKSNKRIFAHVVDECPRDSSSCRENKQKARKTGRILVDVHRSAWKALGLKRYKLHKLQAKYINTISRKNGSIKPVLSRDGIKGYVPTPWK